MVDSDGIQNFPLNYKIDIFKGNKLVKSISSTKYVVEYPYGFNNGESKLVTGEEAVKRYQDFTTKIQEYSKRVLEYYNAYAEYENKLNEFLNTPQTFVNNMPMPPDKPDLPNEYVTEPENGYLVVLPAGKYHLLIRNPKGEVVPKSRRNLVVFSKKEEGIGYQILPETKWTQPMQSDDYNSHIFGLGNHTFYIKPFKVQKFNKHHFLKLSKLHSPVSGKGLENTDCWVYTSEITARYTLEVVKHNKVIAKIEQKPYFVKQRPGHNLGYDIVDFDIQSYPDEKPTFYAYKFTIPDSFGEYQLRLVNQEGIILKTSIRKVYPLRKPSLMSLLAIASLPLLGINVNFLKRWKILTNKSKNY